MLSVKNVSIVRVERKKFIFQNLPLDKSHFITGIGGGLYYFFIFNAMLFPFGYYSLIFISFFRDKGENAKSEYYKMFHFLI